MRVVCDDAVTYEHAKKDTDNLNVAIESMFTPPDVSEATRTSLIAFQQPAFTAAPWDRRE